MRPRSAAASIALALALVWPDPGAAHGDLDAQIAAATARIEREPRGAALHLRRGELHRAHRDWPAALADYDRAAELDPALGAVDLARAALALDAGTPEPALAAVERFLGRQPDHAEGRVLRARALTALGRPLEAADEWRRAIAASPQPRPEHYLERARLLALDPARIGQALAALDDGLRRLGPVVTLELAALDLELRRGRHDEALARLERLAAASGRKELWLVRRGEILEQAGRLAEARDAFAGALRAVQALPPTRRHTRATEELETRSRTALDRLGERR